VSRWRESSEREAAQLAQELLRELAEGHSLHGRPARAIARRIDNDDVAFVHLTWAGTGDVQWPRFELVERLPEEDD